MLKLLFLILLTTACAKKSELGETCADASSCSGDLYCVQSQCSRWSAIEVAQLSLCANLLGLRGENVMTYLEKVDCLKNSIK